jgi:nicotinate dehydrogenase subunit A
MSERIPTAAADANEPVSVELRVNGVDRRIPVDPSTPLLYVLRNDLGLRAAKFGCGMEQCGACAVLVGSEPCLACVLPVGQVGGREVTTLEGLHDSALWRSIERAFLAENAGQCGYCLPGILVATSALLAWNSCPSDEEICRALVRHLCRCGAHGSILRAVRRAADELKAGADE